MVLGNPFINDNRVLREATTLAEAGYIVKIYASYSNDLPKHQKINGYEVVRLKVRNYSPFGLSPFKFSRALNILISEKPDIYHAHDLDTLLICYLAGKRTKAKIVYDAHEYWPSRTSFNNKFLGFIKNLIREPLFRIMERLLIKKVDAVISANESSATAYSNYYKIKKPTALYNFHSLENQKNSNVLRKSLGLENKKIILFLGGINKGRGILQLVESLKLFPEDFHLVFLGEGPYKREGEQLAEKLNLSSRVHFLKAVRPNDVVKWASSASVGVSPIQNISKSYYFSSPNKVFEYIMAGLPIAVSNFPEMKKVLSKYEVGETFDPDDPKSIAQAIKRIFDDNTRYQKLKDNALKAAREEYNWEKESTKLINLYKNL